jgi:amidohydrolase
MNISDKVIKNLTLNRRELHKIPELGFQEIKTQAYLFEKLELMGYKPEKICNTGIYIYIDNGKDFSFAFRSDMDALPIVEKNNIDFISNHDGIMHGCGHDGHMATLLGFAEYLTTIDKVNIPFNILLIFQPAEEGPGGAKNIIESGLLKSHKARAIFGLHLFPNLPEGKIGTKAGSFMASCNEITVTITGKSGHCGQPQLGVDSIQIAMKFLENMNIITTKMLSPFDPSIISFNKINGGTVGNVTAEKTKIEGTIRSFSLESLDLIKEKIKQTCTQLEVFFDCKIDTQIIQGYPVVNNDKNYYNILKSALEKTKKIDFVELEPEMLAEDFSFYLNEIPGLFYYVGTKNEKKGFITPLHNCKFNFDEKALEYALISLILIFEELNSKYQNDNI